MKEVKDRLARKGYMPIAMNEYGGISWQGESLGDFWMWNRQYINDKDGEKTPQTVRISELKEAALRIWRDGWVPVEPVSDDLLRKMEAALRAHTGLKSSGVNFPDGGFLQVPDRIPHAEIEET